MDHLLSKEREANFGLALMVEGSGWVKPAVFWVPIDRTK